MAERPMPKARGLEPLSQPGLSLRPARCLLDYRGPDYAKGEGDGQAPGNVSWKCTCSALRCSAISCSLVSPPPPYQPPSLDRRDKGKGQKPKLKRPKAKYRGIQRNGHNWAAFVRYDGGRVRSLLTNVATGVATGVSNDLPPSPPPSFPPLLHNSLSTTPRLTKFFPLILTRNTSELSALPRRLQERTTNAHMRC